MPRDRNEISRRDVLRGAGAAAIFGAVAPSLSAKEPKAIEGLTMRGPGATPIRLLINGQKHQVELEPRVTLLDALRDHVGMTGAKRICDRGACGGCTVMVDGKTVNSCLMLAVDAEGREIRTIEGLANGDQLHPIQDAFVKHDALQCGFCTPGMVMSCTALVESNPNPSLDDMKAAVAGNLCRCGTYPHVFDACRTASKEMKK
ncbi:MAG: (2Fe-2S)-binding protein [Planctomycetota bacterium]